MTQTSLCFLGHTIKVYLINGTSDNKIVDKILFCLTHNSTIPLRSPITSCFKDAGTFLKFLAVEFIEMLFNIMIGYIIFFTRHLLVFMLILDGG